MLLSIINSNFQYHYSVKISYGLIFSIVNCYMLLFLVSHLSFARCYAILIFTVKFHLIPGLAEIELDCFHMPGSQMKVKMNYLKIHSAQTVERNNYQKTYIG